MSVKRLRAASWIGGLSAFAILFAWLVTTGQSAPALLPSAPPVLSETVSLNGLHGWTAQQGNHLKIFDVALDENLNRTTGKLYTAGMEHTEVAVVDAQAVSLDSLLDIGNAVEAIAVAPSDGTAYFTNRLGGSTLMIYRTGSGAWNEMVTGGWPTAVDVDTGLNRLFVLSHYEGAVTAYALAPDPLNPTLLGSVSLGLTDSEDALSSLTVDSAHHRVITTPQARTAACGMSTATAWATLWTS